VTDGAPAQPPPSLFVLSYSENGVSKRFDVPAGEAVMGRALSCALVLADASVSRTHASLMVRDGKLYVQDLGSRFGTFKNDVLVTAQIELLPGDRLMLGKLRLDVDGPPEAAVSLDESHVIDVATSFFRPIEPRAPSAGPDVASPAVSVDAVRLMTLLSEIGGTLVVAQPLQQVLEKIVDLTFGSVPAERAFLLLRTTGELKPEVARSRDGRSLTGVRISRTVVEQVLRDRVAMLASDTAVDTRLVGAVSMQDMSVRSFMCAPLWNRNAVIGALYVDNPFSKRFTPGDLDVFTALANYAAVAIEQARLTDELLDETRRRERLQRYHSPGVVSRILDGGVPAEGHVAAQAREVSVLFADIVEFTSLSQRLGPGEVVALLSSFFELVTDVIFEYEGTLDKFIGDCVMAVFGAPFDQADHARRAVETARDVRRALVAFNRQIAPVSLQLRMAINSGPAMVGDVGSAKRREFAVLGDVVNAASRLERLAEPGQILMSEATYVSAGSDLRVKSLGRVTLRGQVGEVGLFELLD